MLAGSISDVRPLLWGTLVGYLIQSVWLFWLASRVDGFRGRPHLGRGSEHWPALVKAAGVMLIGQVDMSFVVTIAQYTAANLGSNANATLGFRSEERRVRKEGVSTFKTW